MANVKKEWQLPHLDVLDVKMTMSRGGGRPGGGHPGGGHPGGGHPGGGHGPGGPDHWEDS